MSAGPLGLCVLFGSIVGSARLLEKLDEGEARRAVDRCLHRMERATVAEKGRVRRMDVDGFMAEVDSEGLYNAKDLLGHSRVETTERHYVHANRRKAVVAYQHALHALRTQRKRG